MAERATKSSGAANLDAGRSARRRELPDVDLGAEADAPPAYGDGDNRGQIQLAQAGLAAGATVTADGRVDINIHQSTGRFAELLAPALRTQLLPKEKSQQPLPPSYVPPSLGGRPGQVPPPRLNVVVQIVGSRGDVQPFVALGRELKDTYGHRVRIATHSTFKGFIEENGLEFFSIGGDPSELMAFMVKNPGLMPGIDALKQGEIRRRRLGIEQILLGCWRSCFEAGDGSGPPPQTHRPNEPLDDRHVVFGSHRPFVADAIIANPPSFAAIHLVEKMGIPLHMMFTMPWSPTRAFPHPLSNIESANTDEYLTNYVTYALVEMMTWQGLGDVINRFREKVLDLEPLSLIWAPGLLSRLRVPTTYCWSPALIPKPADWTQEVTVSGFYFLDLATSYMPDPELAAFLDAGPAPVYIGFGSIVVDNPNALTRIIFDAVAKAGVRALVSKGWGGIGADSISLPDGVFMLGNCPHDWLFKRVACVVHHGGAGTTAAGIRLGRPTVVVPFFGDQPFWGAMVSRAGAGPDPIPHASLTAEKLAAAILEALKPETLSRAAELGRRISEEQGTKLGGKSFHDFLDTDSLRCSLAPSRVAVWRVRRSRVRLSALCAAVLLREGVLEPGDLRLYRPREYHTDGQPWDPITAVTAALVGDLSTIAMAISDIPRELFGGNKKKKNEAASAGGTLVGGSTKTTPSQSDSAAVAAPRNPKPAAQEQEQSLANLSATAPSSRPSLRRRPTSSVSDLAASSTHFGERWSSADDPGKEGGQAEVAEPASHRDEGITNLPPDAPTPTAAAGGLGSPSPAGPSISALEATWETGKGVARIVDTGLKTPMNLCMGLARGFRNMPKLYNDETVRPPERVTSFASGLKVAGKEFGLGFYDGLAGLVTQPLKGAEKEGGFGAVKGFGKGLGGLILKPAAAVWSLPAYTMQGVHAEIRTRNSRSWQNYVVGSRLAQGKEDLEHSSPGEQGDVLVRWHARHEELKEFYKLRQEDRDGRTRDPSIYESKRLHALRDGWDSRRARDAGIGSATMVSEPVSGEMEHAIRSSVQQTSQGDPAEDARVEQAIRSSVSRVCILARGASPPAQRGTWAQAGGLPDKEVANEEISDEEYQALVQEAVRQSLLLQTTDTPQGWKMNSRDEFGSADDGDESRRVTEADELKRAIEESRSYGYGRAAGWEMDDEDLQLAMKESERMHQEELRQEAAALGKEEEIVLEYVKKQSLAEEEYRRVKARGKAVEAGRERDGGDEDNDLKRAIEESLRLGRGGSGGGSGGLP